MMSTLIHTESLPAEDAELFARVRSWSGQEQLTEAALRAIAADEGLDFATAFLFDRLVQSPEVAAFRARLEALTEVIPPPRNAMVVIVPGAFYREFPHTGSDGRLVREEAEQLGFQTAMVPLLSLGALETNARILLDFLAEHRGRRIVLVSLSKGGSDVKIALTQPGAHEVFRGVTHWINLSGLVNGTPLVPWLFASRLRTLWFRLLFWWRGYDFTVLPQLARGPGTPLHFDLELPKTLRTIHVIGFPLRRHLSNALARRCHRRLEPHGPNDGAGILLADTLRLPGLVYPVWGADHYLRPGGKDLRPLARKLLLHVRDELPRIVPEDRGSRIEKRARSGEGGSSSEAGSILDSQSSILDASREAV